MNLYSWGGFVEENSKISVKGIHAREAFSGLRLVREKSGKFKVREKSGNFVLGQGNLRF